VVADEVRNLAMRAAEAAKNTSDLIEGTVKKVKEGSDLLAVTDGEFYKVTVSVEQSADLVGEISAASHEQAQGIELVNRAVCDMDKVVQRNAANAEQSASASKEMSAQAVQMKEFVVELRCLVDGSGSRQTIGDEGAENPNKSRRKSENFIPKGGRILKDSEKGRAESGRRTAEEKLIALDGEDTSDF
jgi:methyl-accepting chemotaxis protein